MFKLLEGVMGSDIPERTPWNRPIFSTIEENEERPSKLKAPGHTYEIQNKLRKRLNSSARRTLDTVQMGFE